MKKLFLVACTMLLAACGSTSGYKAAEIEGGTGYRETQIEGDRYRVTYRGTSLMSREKVETYLLYRAAELTLEKGFDYFITVKTDTDKKTSYRSKYPLHHPFYGRFFYYHYTGRWALETEFQERQRFTAHAVIVMGKGAKPANDPSAYDAREVKKHLEPLINKGETA